MLDAETANLLIADRAVLALLEPAVPQR